jgi:hypothetical protein
LTNLSPEYRRNVSLTSEKVKIQLNCDEKFQCSTVQPLTISGEYQVSVSSNTEFNLKSDNLFVYGKTIFILNVDVPQMTFFPSKIFKTMDYSCYITATSNLLFSQSSSPLFSYFSQFKIKLMKDDNSFEIINGNFKNDSMIEFKIPPFLKTSSLSISILFTKNEMTNPIYHFVKKFERIEIDGKIF